MSKYSDPKEVLPLEWYLYKTVCPFLAPIAYEQIGLTPNMITMLGFVMSILALNSLKNKNFLMFTIFLVIRQVLDALDGYVARKYKHFSKWGEILDHALDEITIFGVVLLVWRSLGFKKLTIFSIVGIIQTYFQDKRVKCIQNKDRRCLRRTRIFSCFDNLLFLILFIYILYKI